MPFFKSWQARNALFLHRPKRWPIGYAACWNLLVIFKWGSRVTRVLNTRLWEGVLSFFSLLAFSALMMRSVFKIHLVGLFILFWVGLCCFEKILLLKADSFLMLLFELLYLHVSHLAILDKRVQFSSVTLSQEVVWSVLFFWTIRNLKLHAF